MFRVEAFFLRSEVSLLFRTFFIAVLAFAGCCPAVAFGQAAPAAAPAAGVTAEQRQFVRQQLDQLKVKAVFGDSKPVEPKTVVDALLARGKPLLPALQEALPNYEGAARAACARAILLLTWGFDPDEVIGKALAKEMHGKPFPADAKPKPMTDPFVIKAFPYAKPYELSLENEPPADASLKMHNVVLLSRDGNVAILNTPRVVENYFKAAHRPATQPAAAAAPPPPAVDEAYVRDLLTAWLTLNALTASDSKQTFTVAADTIAIHKNGVRWVATGRAVPNNPNPQKPAERQLLVVLSPDGAVLTSMETTGLRPLKK